ncbi:MAG: hypothetical protein ACYCQI_12850 [Gammaproteobacteria bacterium]
MQPRANVNEEESTEKSPCSLLSTLSWFMRTLRDNKKLLFVGFLLAFNPLASAQQNSVRKATCKDFEGNWEGNVEGHYRAGWIRRDWKGGVSVEARNTHRLFGLSKWEGWNGSLTWKADGHKSTNDVQVDGWCTENQDGTVHGVLRTKDKDTAKLYVHLDLNTPTDATILVTQLNKNAGADRYRGTATKNLAKPIPTEKVEEDRLHKGPCP